MKQIENFQLMLDWTVPQEVQLPSGTKPLCLRILQNLPVVYIIGDPNGVLVTRRFIFVRTNQSLADDFDERWEYVDTFQYSDGKGLVMFHLFADRDLSGVASASQDDGGSTETLLLSTGEPS